ncbi:alpha/beta hydrolase [Anaerobacillus sp. MEB173]|uniref:alpha/beta hydrolase n=1 Tax=Anaerobacillus sp. MEB173 TaxID=3383345 RepID=UPI003F8E0BC7
MTTNGTIIDDQLFSEYLQEERALIVYLPNNFSPLYTYHLVIVQDGKDYFQLGRIARIADELIEKREIEELIIVGVPYNNVAERRELYHPNGKKSTDYIRFLAGELVPYIEAKYPTHQLASGRTLIGDSLAGTGSLLAAFTFPHTFGQVIMQSPYVNDTLIDLTQQFRHPELLNIYHVIGNQETAVKTTANQTKDFLTPNRELMKQMRTKGVNYFYDEFDGNHTWTYWQPDLKRAFQHMFKI